VAAVDAVGAADANTYLGVNSSTALQVQGPSGTAYVRQATAADDTLSNMENSASAIATAAVINEKTSETGVAATVTATTFTVADNAERFDALDIDGVVNTLKINGTDVVVNMDGATQAARRQQFIDAVNLQVSGVVASAGAGNGGLVLTAADGRNISVQIDAGVGDGSTAEEVFGHTTDLLNAETVIARGGVTLQAAGDITTTFVGGAQVGGDGASASVATTLASLGVDTVGNANTTMIVADAILDTISEARGALGAVQNRLASTVANLGVVSEKVSDARSRILDADFAAETAALTKAQILQQAGIAILSQANANPQQVLALLRG
jgi:flagellin